MKDALEQIKALIDEHDLMGTIILVDKDGNHEAEYTLSPSWSTIDVSGFDISDDSQFDKAVDSATSAYIMRVLCTNTAGIIQNKITSNGFKEIIDTDNKSLRGLNK